MPLHIIREDITRMTVDAIVAAGSAMPGVPMPTGGVNGSIHKKAGASLLQALRRLGGIRTGGATLTEAYDLPCRYVIHTAGPMWKGGNYGEAKLLRSCYDEALKLAQRQGFASIAFPLISAGKYGYPKAEALTIATQAIRAFLNEHDMDVYLVVYDKESFEIGSSLFTGLVQYINQNYVDAHYTPRNRREEDWAAHTLDPMPPEALYGEAANMVCTASMPVEDAASEAMDWGNMEFAPAPKAAAKPAQADIPRGLLNRLNQLDAGFADTLLHLIDQRGMKDSTCYRRANVDRKLFNKIKNTPGYTPKKSTVAAFCIALELDLPTARELLARAGYGLSHANIFDVILEYFILKGEYDVDVINQVLFAYDQPRLGSIVD